MSRAVSDASKAELFAQETDACFAYLLVIEHPSLEEPLRFNDSGEDIVSNGETYSAFPFELSLPDDDENAAPRAKLRIDNTTREIVATIRTLRPAPTAHFMVIRTDDPDVIEAEFPDFKLSNVTYDVNVVEADLTVEYFTAEPYPGDTFNPADFPGIF